jgi:hypothetical protein
MADTMALAHVLAQVEAAKSELVAYAPVGLDWYTRSMAAASALVPWLLQEAPGLRVYVQEVLNSPALLRSEWTTLRSQINASANVTKIDELLLRQDVLLSFIAGDTVSRVVTKYLLSNDPTATLAENSKSDYPDIFVKSHDYSMLPVRSRKDEYIGAALRGKDRKPVRVPDGLEIKTSRNKAAIDCHFPHVGLHLMLSFNKKGDKVAVDDVLVAFLRYDDYRITKPKTEATTLKASFSRAPFVSLLPTAVT